MENSTETKVDYFLRYTAILPAGEEKLHSPFNSDCPCQPEVTFDEKNCWRTLRHKELK